jgi:DNA polymerase III gamma/tau subunit
MEYYKLYRPKLFKYVLGQREAVRTLQQLLKKPDNFPHCLLFTGASGCGKTTLARILKEKLLCSDNDFTEVDAAEFRGIEFVRELKNQIWGSPIGGKCRIWYLDECHMLTTEAQNALLKVLEDTPRHVYFMLATTEPGKVKGTILTRSTEIKVEPLAKLDLQNVISRVAAEEKLKLSETLIARICEVSNGSARKALVLLNQVAEIEDEKDRIRAVLASDTKRQAIEIARAIINPKAKWKDVTNIIKGVDDDPEQLRWLILSYATTVLLGGGPLAPRANLIIQEFRDPFYETKRAGLVSACYMVVSTRLR